MDKAERQKKYLSLLKGEIALAMGCTEPAAAALAGAYAAKALKEPVCTAQVLVSQYILKNGMNVGIPGTGAVGLEIACAMGLISKEPKKELMILSGIGEAQKSQAKRLAQEKKIKIGLADTEEKIYIEVRANSQNHSACAVLAGTHKTLRLLKRDEEVLYREEGGKSPGEHRQQEESGALTLKEIEQFARQVPKEELEFLKEGLRVNREIAQEGVCGSYGLCVGKNMLWEGKQDLAEWGVANYAAAMAAAAADARMAGCELPVMSTAGSGNQGLTATVPIVAVGERLHIPEEKIVRAAALSILLTVHTKQYLGRLSVLCGCSIAAAMGVGCGVVFLLDGSYEQMCRTVSTIAADISGVVCDGAKPGCALKIATAVDSAVRAAKLALNGSGAGSHDGIVAGDVEETLKNLGILGNTGMRNTNHVILQMMLQKQGL